MTDPLQNGDRFRRAFVLMLVIGITAAFLWMVWAFVMTVVLAAILAGLFHPLYRRLNARPVSAAGWPRSSPCSSCWSSSSCRWRSCSAWSPARRCGCRRRGAAAPGSRRAPQPAADAAREALYEHIAPYRAQILARAGELIGNLGRFAVTSISATTAGTASAILQFFILLYTLFFLLIDGPALLRKITSYLPLREGEKELVLDKFVSVTRATLRGTLVIGIVQGTLGGLSFWAAGIDGALFWGTMMVVLSVLPVVGGALVWVPAVIVLAIQGHSAVGARVDRLQRADRRLGRQRAAPRLVGRDTEMHDLMILFSTLGGIAAFGPMGFVIGPILAAVFVTSWEIFGTAFEDVIPSRSRSC